MNAAAPHLSFLDRPSFRRWLEANHATSEGIWLVFQKGSKSFTANAALEEALCFGWIDGLIKSIDEGSYKKYFSKRKDRKKWSEKNKALFQELKERGVMTAAGLAVHGAGAGKPKGGSARKPDVEALRAALADDGEALRLFGERPPSKQRQMAGFYCEAKGEETRRKRKGKIIEALRSGAKGMLY